MASGGTYAPASDNRPTRTLFLSNLPWSVTESSLAEKLKSICSQGAQQLRAGVEGFTVAYDEGGKSKGYAFIACRDEEASAALRSLLDGSELGGRRISATFSVKKKRQILAESYYVMEDVEECKRNEGAQLLGSAPAGGSASSSTASFGAPAPLTKSAKRRLKRQRAIAAAEAVAVTCSTPTTPRSDTGMNTDNDEVLDEEPGQPQRKKRNHGESYTAGAPRSPSNVVAPASANEFNDMSCLETIQVLCTDLRENLHAIPQLEKYFTALDQARISPSTGHPSTRIADTEHACMKKVRFYIRTMARVWKQFEVLSDGSANREGKSRASPEDVAFFRTDFLAVFQFLLEIMRYLLNQHLAAVGGALQQSASSSHAAVCASPSVPVDAISGSGLAPIEPHQFGWSCAMLLTKSIHQKDSPIRQCRRIIENVCTTIKCSSDSWVSTVFRNTSDDMAAVEKRYDHLLFQAGQECERIIAGANAGMRVLTSSISIQLVDPPLHISPPRFSSSLVASVDEEATRLLSRYMVQSADDCRRIHEMCLNSLNADSEAAFQQALTKLPSAPSIHARFRFLRSLLHLVRSTLQLSSQRVSIQPYGSFVSGTAATENSDLDIQIVLHDSVDRSSFDSTLEFARSLLVRIRHALQRRSLQTESGQLNARVPVLKIRPTNDSAADSSRSQSSSAAWIVPCECDISVMHEEDFIREDWYDKFRSPSEAALARPVALSPNLLKSMYLSCYLFHRPSVRRLFALLRHWFTSREINSAGNNTLSTFSWTLMIIYALQHQTPPSLPVIPTSSIQKHLLQLSDSGACASTDSATVELLHSFFLFYAEFDATSLRVDTTDARSLHARESAPSMHPPLHLVDPIEPHENPARSVQSVQQWMRIKRECQRAMYLMERLSDATSVLRSLVTNSRPSEIPPEMDSSLWSQLHLLFG